MPMMPKGRYRVMTAYMPKVGSHGLDMMYRTCTVQANLDFSSEADMVKKLRVALALQPVATALFANSPITEGKPNGFLSFRSEIWRDTDADRSGMLPWAFEPGMGYERWADYALDVPMYFVKRGDRYIDVAGSSFRQLMAGKLAALPGERELLCAVFAQEEDDARYAVACWDVLADAFRLERVHLVPPSVDGLPALPGLHPTRSAHVVARSESVGFDGFDGLGGFGRLDGLDDHDGVDGSEEAGPGVVIGSVGEIDPDVATTLELTRPSGSGAGIAARRIGWLEVDLGLLFDEARVARRITSGGAVSRYPSSDIDLAFVVEDRHPADAVAETLREAAGDLLESVRLFDVYRGLGIAEGTRSLAFRLRFVSPLRTLTDEEVGELRARCIEAVEQRFGAVLR